MKIKKVVRARRLHGPLTLCLRFRYSRSKRSLDTGHRAAIRIATGAFRTTSLHSLLAEAHGPPLAIRRQLLGMQCAVKLRQFPSHPTYSLTALVCSLTRW